jgi:hypothetical protein
MATQNFSYQEKPFDLIYMFYRSYIVYFRSKYKKEIDSYNQPGFERYSFFDTKEQRTLHIVCYAKEKGLLEIRLYYEGKSFPPPDFEDNHGFDGKNYTAENMLVITLDSTLPDIVKIHDGKEGVILNLSPFKADIKTYPFSKEDTEFSFFLWEAYKCMMENAILEKADY